MFEYQVRVFHLIQGIIAWSQKSEMVTTLFEEV